MAGRVHVETDDIIKLGGEVGSLDRLKVLIRCGWSLWAAHMRWIVRSERPIALAMARPVQWVTAPGGSRRVRSTTACTFAAALAGCRADGLVAQQTLNAFLGEALLPAPHHRPAVPEVEGLALASGADLREAERARP